MTPSFVIQRNDTGLFLKWKNIYSEYCSSDVPFVMRQTSLVILKQFSVQAKF